MKGRWTVIYDVTAKEAHLLAVIHGAQLGRSKHVDQDTAIHGGMVCSRDAAGTRRNGSHRAGREAAGNRPAKGEVNAPLRLWAPYPWADGTKGRKLDALVWQPEDLGGDGTHPLPAGRE